MKSKAPAKSKPLASKQNSTGLSNSANNNLDREVIPIPEGLKPYLGTHVLTEDAYEIQNQNFVTLKNGNIWLGYHETVAGQVGTNGIKGTPQYYKTLYTSQYSTTHTACVKTIAEFTVGCGLNFDAAKKEKWTIQQSKINTFVSEQLEEVLMRAVYSFLVFGDSYVFQDEKGGLDFWDLEHLRINTEGTSKAVRAGLIPPNAVLWGFAQIPPTTSAIYPNKDDMGNAYQTVYRIKNRIHGAYPWTTPENIAAEQAARREYNINAGVGIQFVRGVAPSIIITVNGESVTSQEFKQITQYVREQSSGLAANGSIAVVPGGVGNETMGINVLNNPTIPDHKENKASTRNDIIASFQLSESLVGFATAGKLGSSQERNEEYKAMLERVIKPLRAHFAKNLIRPYLEFCKVYLGCTLIDEFIGFNELVSLNFSDGVQVEKVLTTNEQRAIIGFPPIDDENADIPMGLLETTKMLGEISAQSAQSDNLPQPQP